MSGAAAAASPGSAAGALRRSLCAFGRDELCVCRITGGDRVDFMHRIVSADVRGVEVGQGMPAALLTPKGRVIADMTLLVEHDALTMVLDAAVAERVLELLDRYIIVDDVELGPLDNHAVVSVHGPKLAESALLGALADLAPYAHRSLTLGSEPGVEALAFADDHLGVPGVALLLERSQRDAVLDVLGAEGVAHGDADSYEVARLEAGVPRMQRELDEDVLILEAGQLARVSFNKGCYIGQEPVCRVNSRGRVQRLLVGLRVGGERLPDAGEALGSPEKSNAGRITSAARSPNLGGAIIALGYVHRSCSEVGTTLSLAGGGQAEVVALPHIEGALQPVTAPRYN